MKSLYRIWVHFPSMFINWYHRDKLNTYETRNLFFLILHSSQIGLSFRSIKKWLFGKVHGVSSFFSSEIKLKILKPNNWLKIESSSIWKPRKLLHTPTIQFCLKAFIEKKIQFNNISTKITNVAYSCILKKIKRLQR